MRSFLGCGIAVEETVPAVEGGGSAGTVGSEPVVVGRGWAGGASGACGQRVRVPC